MSACGEGRRAGPRYDADPVRTLPRSPHPPTFRGRYTNAFEESRLEPCGSNESWWLDGDDADWAPFGSRVVAFMPGPRTTMVGDRAVVYVVVRGDTTPRGEYGHLGHYQRELVLRGVDTVRAWRASDCAR